MKAHLNYIFPERKPLNADPEAIEICFSISR